MSGIALALVPDMTLNALTFLSYGLVGYLVAPAIILLLAALRKRNRGRKRFSENIWVGAAMIALCALILFTTLYPAIAPGKTHRIEAVLVR